ncbi:MAG: MiaB-like protein tRNA modifying enzyme [Candidatus Falkowbacteria bacterium GW2011_GWC2_38_22]|uniref:MiaB-like protein tRNA modifying enzyme n=1 Tax=Candidatus Falkowbacteria bacterium GW2011_GWE1_38_31 TaxID=1618638 RepID=A0A0G0JSJ5_9BACT|nr:MAG: MiaB-like protein tRNA modifying enzyme [Candidatus Falkowbacteria bacterium GW2011_GWF2_38_1205]KKQ60539.1 MAG: MiaB-like protein tRNA modifying enzyme [Candidatus Falkowbacteria bacterium GW2011_GWC2_38_22]KKQ62658.1 MAG: MiaB-like protein tRNA modifying enzyme [Candidatus Falkowbacteria bacterium GW2011_GWF1_38_22]KKQ64718.1 MAG: MiaB-like protein tRNA modifying enzyme [Candidatus Falkowbacteria bacterium GW2011_GWE2_38_254]KKQ69597.1 MAG: MiaB-like protein tRNA modifying enzyme [Can
MPNTFKIYTLGCKVNRYDSGTVKAELIATGLKPVLGKADLVLVNTCSVTESAIHKNKRMINKARQENPLAKVVLLGCWPKIDIAQATNAGADIIWGTGKFNELILQINNLFPDKNNTDFKIPGLSSIDRARYFLKIQDGCEQFCSYCIIPFARGKYQSRDSDELLLEAESAVKLGYEEIVLCGVHLGMYGREGNNETKTNLCGIIKKILKIKGLGRIRLSSIEINEVTDELIDLMKKNRKICRHLHIPLQGGTDRILKAMNRPYNIAFFKNKIDKIQKELPDVAISTDVIVGFPGETKIDFEKTKDFIRKCEFSRLHVFSFSAHKKTKAYAMPDHIEKLEIKHRSEELRVVSKNLEKNHLEKYRNKKLIILVEKQSDDNYMGKSEYYFNINFTKNDVTNWFGHKSNDSLIKKLVEIKN